MEIISKTENGIVFKCSNCSSIHIEFKNLNFNFSERQYKEFSDYVLKMNSEELEAKNSESLYHRKIIISLGYKNFNVLLNKSEVAELKELLTTEVADIELFETLIINNEEITLSNN